ncbi:hypothetical protein Glove_168g120 [Diversispora epigaea]|uniref:Protein kinase domain-containing protein n=1 Tax=Diversispora epigaea TaxID=1348612 RepID=A0A397IPQ1_9GLOM|nr:hypothetical protein Glove_168g120 [Diversispora epigaea]
MPECNRKYDGYWCKPCNSKHFNNDFNKWTSGLMDELENVILKINNGKRDRNYVEVEVALKKFDNFVNLNDVLNELQKLYNIWDLSSRLISIHELDIVHQDFHPEISYHPILKVVEISDFRLIGANPKKGIYLMNYCFEIVTGFPPYLDIPHDKDLAIKNM